MSESIDKALDFATSQLTSIIDAAKATAPQALDAAMTVVRFTAASNLWDGVVSIGFAIAGAVASKKLWVWAQKLENVQMEGVIPAYIGAVVVGVLSAIALIVGISELTSIWNWVGIWHPELYAIHQALGAATSHK